MSTRAPRGSAVRTMLIVPFTQDGALLGDDHHRSPGGPAVLRQADRAVARTSRHRRSIAMENARLIDRDARGAGAADRDHRGAPGHQRLARRPRAGVRAMVEKAMRLCEARNGMFWTFDGESVSSASHSRGSRRNIAGFLHVGNRPAGHEPARRLGGDVVHIADLTRTRLPVSTTRWPATVELGGAPHMACIVRCARTRPYSATITSTARKCGPSPKSRSPCCKFRRPGGDRDRECSAARRIAGPHR